MSKILEIYAIPVFSGSIFYQALFISKNLLFESGARIPVINSSKEIPPSLLTS